MDEIIQTMLSIRQFITSLREPIVKLRDNPESDKMDTVTKLTEIQDKSLDITEKFIEAIAGKKVAEQGKAYEPSIVVSSFILR